MAAAQRLALQLPPRRAAKTVKMPTISRAEGGQLQAPVGRASWAAVSHSFLVLLSRSLPRGW